MAIDPNIIIASSTAVGAAVGGAISLLAARRQAHIDALEARTKRLERDYIEACEQISAFHKLEEAHTKEHAALTGKTENQVKLEIRKKVEDAGGGRPTWSAREALNEIKRTQG